MDPELRAQIDALIAENRSVVVCSLDQDGFPNAKAMFKLEHHGLKEWLFSTNTSSMRVSHFQRDPRACLYFLGQSKINGLMLVGQMQICTDPDTKARLWFDGCEKYYPLGVTDPDYCVLKFTAQHGSYYHNLEKHKFEVDG